MKVVKNANKSGSFPNVITIQKSSSGELEYVEENVNDILRRNENMYAGWLCWSGSEGIYINAAGNVYNATCRTDHLGNIHTEFTLPNGPIVCKKNYCACAADLNTSKAENAESAKYLRNYKNEQH